MIPTVRSTLVVRCVQHPNGDYWVTADRDIPSHWKVLAETNIEVEFAVDPGYAPERSYPEGRFVDK